MLPRVRKGVLLQRIRLMLVRRKVVASIEATFELVVVLVTSKIKITILHEITRTSLLSSSLVARVTELANIHCSMFIKSHSSKFLTLPYQCII